MMVRLPVLTAGLVLALASSSARAETAAAASTAKTPPPFTWADTYEKGRSSVMGDGRFLLLDFYTDWCGWCKRLDKDVFAKPSFQQAASGVLGVKINAEKRRDLAQKYAANRYPRLFFLDSRGRTVEIIRGYIGLAEFTAKVGQVKSGNTELSRLETAAGERGDLGSTMRLARFLTDTGQLEEGLPHWQMVHDLALEAMFSNPALEARNSVHHRQALYQLGRAYLAAGLPDISEQHYVEVIGSYPGSPEASESVFELATRAATAGDSENLNRFLDQLTDEYRGTPAHRRSGQLRNRLNILTSKGGP
ncbi:MAG: thioredoxin fold domain-containing protein [Acidobacteriota bacterium]